MGKWFAGKWVHSKKVCVPKASGTRLELLKQYAGYDREKQVKPYGTKYVLGGKAPGCLLPSGKRIMLDPTYRLYLKDGDGEYVSLERLREMLLKDEPFFANEAASYNEKPFDSEHYRNYMTKNTFRFCRGTFYREGSEDWDRRRVQILN